MKLCSWNINGLRAVLKKPEFLTFLEQDFDIFCFQEIKAKPEQVAEWQKMHYQQIWHSAERAGYSGTLILSRVPIIATQYGLPQAIIQKYSLGADQFGDVLSEGRVLTVELEDFYLVNVYTPNSKQGLARLGLRYQQWDPAFLEFLQLLEQNKPVVVCGDFNAAHQEIDLARPKTNHKSAGFTDQERAGIEKIIRAGWIDTFRYFYPEKIQYTWWSHYAGARAKNVGWRIDYFFASKQLLARLNNPQIHDQIFGSDHCPISLEVH